jgi:hypothetical protein
MAPEKVNDDHDFTLAVRVHAVVESFEQKHHLGRSVQTRMWPFRKRDLCVQDGALVINPRGSRCLDGASELLKSVVPLIEGCCRDEIKRTDQGDGNREDALIEKLCNHFAIACVWDAARRHYGQDQGSLFVDACFYRIYSKYPSLDEPFHRYISLPLFRDGKPQIQLGNEPRPLRADQFAEDITGYLGFFGRVAIAPIGLCLATDCLEILKSSDPLKTGQSLGSSFDSRLSSFLQRASSDQKSRE